MRNHCGKNTDILKKQQWDWLEEQFFKVKSEIKIVSSSITALTPTEFLGGLSEFCAYKENKEAFLEAIKDMQEGRKTKGGPKDRYDQW